MEVCYQLPVLPLDRPVPQHVLSRRGAISFSSSSALFGCPNPRQLSQVNAAAGAPTLGGCSFVYLLPPGFTSATPTPQSSPFTPPTSTTRCLGMSRLTPLDSRGFSLILGTQTSPHPPPRPARCWTRVGSGNLFVPSPGAPPSVPSGLRVRNDLSRLPFLDFSVWKLGLFLSYLWSWAHLATPHPYTPVLDLRLPRAPRCWDSPAVLRTIGRFSVARLPTYSILWMDPK